MKKIRFKGNGEELVVGKMVCVAQNYAKHIAEMQGARPDRPVLFLKPSTALVSPGEPVLFPDFSNDVHHEVELVVVIGKTMRRVRREEALSQVAGYGVGLDLTARDWQTEAKKQGGPWAAAKGFDGSAPVSTITPAQEVGDPGDLAIELSLNGELRQSARTSEMLFTVPELLAFASGIFTLEPGDLLFTGTPSGVGPIHTGDEIEAAIERIGRVRWMVE